MKLYALRKELKNAEGYMSLQTIRLIAGDVETAPSGKNYVRFVTPGNGYCWESILEDEADAWMEAHLLSE
jgi:hypothetical protein